MLAVAAVLLVAGLVAAASSGGRDMPADVRRPGDRFLDLLFSFGLVGIAAAFAAAAVVYAFGWHLKLGEERLGGRASSLSMLLLGALVLGAIVYARRNRSGPGSGEAPETPAELPGSADPTAAPTGYEPEFTTTPVLVALGALAAAALALWLARRGRRTGAAPRLEGQTPASLEEVLAGTLDDLRAEPDPRRAVIAAYARLEQALSAAGHPRRRSDAPAEYLSRVLREAAVSPLPVARLTSLFARAKFSPHEVGEAMRVEAIDALQDVREELRAAEAVPREPVPA